MSSAPRFIYKVLSFKHLLHLESSKASTMIKHYQRSNYSHSLPFLLFACMLSNVVILSCAERPKTAPTDFQELTSFLYEHMLDEDPEELRIGVENTYQWLNLHTKSVQRGYTVKRLSKEAINTTGKSSNPNDLIGGAVLTSHDFDVDKLSRALGIDNVRETNGDAYVKFKRTYEGGDEAGECFADRRCSQLECDSRSTSEWAGGLLKIKYDVHLQFRWVNTKYGPVMLHRSYMNKKPEINLELADVKQGYYIGIVFPPLVPQSSTDQNETPEEINEEMIEEMVNEMADEDADMEDDEVETADHFEATELNIAVDEAVIPTANEWGASAFLQVNWIDIDYGILPVTEDRALEMLVESLIDVAVATEKWMDRNY